jgi:PAS domain S-box-containing protein
VTSRIGHGSPVFGRRSDGSQFPVEIDLGAVMSDQGPFITCVMRDVSDHPRAKTEESLDEDASRDGTPRLRPVTFSSPSVGFYPGRARRRPEVEVKRTRLQTILDSASNAIVHVDAKTDHLRANPAAMQLFGKPLVPEAGRAQWAGQILYPDGRLVPLAELPSSRALQGETPPPAELLIVRSDGTRVPVVKNVAPIRMPGGPVRGVVVVFQDISALKELERVRQEWTAVVAHDLRQPITIILGYASLLAQEIIPAPPRVKAHLDHVLGSSRQLTRMIGDLLDISRIDAHRLTLQHHTVDLPTLVRRVVERLGVITTDRDVRVCVAATVPPLRADAGRIEQVLGNLLSNAAKYGDAGNAIDVEVLSLGIEVQVSVTNRGPGIPAEEIPRLFTRFYRTATPQVSHIPGMGLGLYIAKEVVEAHGGRIWVESIPDRTTTFHFTLPVPAEI